MTMTVALTGTKRRIATWVMASLLVAALVEGVARLAYVHRSTVIAWFPSLMSLHAYDEIDPDHPESWRLKPGFVGTFGQMMPNSERGNSRPDDVFIRINSDGFRGPEIDRTRPHPRILAIGDSCTFGMMEEFSYPRVLETELRTRGHADVEVVNAGVEGYGPKHALYQVDRYLALNASITTIYLGWGPLYAEADAVSGSASWVPQLDSLRLLRRATSYVVGLIEDPTIRLQRVQDESLRRVRAERGAPEISKLDRFVPTAIPDIESLVGLLRSNGTTVVLITLPGLYTLDSAPTERALRIGDLPPFTQNPYVLAKLTERFNSELRALAKRKGLPVVDLDAWSRVALVPREDHFVNSVHLDEQAQALAGRYMAEVLEPFLRAAQTRSGV